MSGQWWESDLIVGPFANITEANAWAAANPSSLFLGLLATINGTQYTYGGAKVGWYRVDGMLYFAVDPFSVVSAASTTPVDFAVTTIKGGSFADGDILEVFFPVETAVGNVGNDVCALFIGAYSIDGASSAGGLLSQARFGITKNGTTTRKIIAAGIALRTNTFSTTAIDWSVDQVIKVRITPATIGNSSYVRHISARLTKC